MGAIFRLKTAPLEHSVRERFREEAALLLPLRVIGGVGKLLKTFEVEEEDDEAVPPWFEELLAVAAVAKPFTIGATAFPGPPPPPPRPRPPPPPLRPFPGEAISRPSTFAVFVESFSEARQP